MKAVLCKSFGSPEDLTLGNAQELAPGTGVKTTLREYLDTLSQATSTRYIDMT